MTEITEDDVALLRALSRRGRALSAAPSTTWEVREWDGWANPPLFCQSDQQQRLLAAGLIQPTPDLVCGRPTYVITNDGRSLIVEVDMIVDDERSISEAEDNLNLDNLLNRRGCEWALSHIAERLEAARRELAAVAKDRR